MNEDKTKSHLYLSKNTIEAYDVYFDNSQGISLYNKRFTSSNKISYRETKFINQILKKYIAQNKGKEIVILDYGCGDGRYVTLFENAAISFKNLGVKLKIISYDPSYSAILSYHKELEKSGYNINELNEQDNPTSSSGYKYSSFSKLDGKITIELVHGNILDDNQYILNLLGGKESIDIIFTMLGVLSHIPTLEYRCSVIQMLYSMVKKNGYFISSLPLHGCFYDELITYNMLREKQKLMQYCGHEYTTYKNIIGIATEEDDIYYHRFDKERKQYVNIYYHLYSLKTLKKEFKKSGLNNTRIYILMSIYRMNTSFTFLSFIDSIISYFADKFKKYFGNFITKNCSYAILINRKKND